MAQFPTTPVPAYPLIIEPAFRTIVTTFDSSMEQRKAKQQFPRFNVNVRYDLISRSEMNTLWTFYVARRGAYESFYFVPPLISDYADTYASLYVGVGNASTTIFDLPGVSTSGQALYHNGVLQVSGFHYHTGSGEAGADQVHYTSAPATGTIISVDFSGYLRAKVRFKEDKMSKEHFMYSAFRTGLDLAGVYGN